MYKIAITGKANTGKNTVGKLLVKELFDPAFYTKEWIHFIAFADPIKQMARLAFPQIPRKWLYGSSKYRNEVIPGAFKNGTPLTVRQLLIDLGNEFGRKYDSHLWIKNFNHRLGAIYKKHPTAVIVTDCRFRDEFEYLKGQEFYQIRIVRDAHTKINDVSETNQDGIADSEFNFVINNNGTKAQLKAQVGEIAAVLQSNGHK